MADDVAERVLEIAVADLEAEARKRVHARASDPPVLLDAARAWAALHVLDRERKLEAALREAYELLRSVSLSEVGADLDGWEPAYRDWRDRWLAGGENLLG